MRSRAMVSLGSASATMRPCHSQRPYDCWPNVSSSREAGSQADNTRSVKHRRLATTARDPANAQTFHALENRVALVLKMLGRLIAHPPPDRCRPRATPLCDAFVLRLCATPSCYAFVQRLRATPLCYAFVLRLCATPSV